MKYLFFLIVADFFFLNSFSQSVASANAFPMNAYDISGKPLTNNGPAMEGSPMLNSNWGKGLVKFKNGNWVRDVELQFNLRENELYFRKNHQSLAFVDTVLEFILAYEEEKIPHSVLYRSGYPFQGKNKNFQFFEVVQDGPFLQLLKLTTKVVVEKNSYGRGKEKEFRESFDWYVFDVKKTEITRVKKDKSSLKQALPDYAERIELLTKENGYKLRSEEEIAELINLLNRQ